MMTERLGPPMEDDLVASGRFARIETTGRRSGAARTVTIGFVDAPDGAIVVAAGGIDADWALNLPTTRPVTSGSATGRSTRSPSRSAG